MPSLLAPLLALLFLGCASEPITAEVLDPGWKRDVGWPANEAGSDGTPPTITAFSRLLTQPLLAN